MIITLTNISAYSVSLSNHEKFKESITMEEFYEDFSENKKGCPYRQPLVSLFMIYTFCFI